MSHTPHQLLEEFPEHVETIHRLKEKDPHFVRLFDQYHEVNREIHRAETDIEPVSDDHMEGMRKQRMVLKDELFSMLKAG